MLVIWGHRGDPALLPPDRPGFCPREERNGSQELEVIVKLFTKTPFFLFGFSKYFRAASRSLLTSLVPALGDEDRSLQGDGPLEAQLRVLARPEHIRMSWKGLGAPIFS